MLNFLNFKIIIFSFNFLIFQGYTFFCLEKKYNSDHLLNIESSAISNDFFFNNLQNISHSTNGNFSDLYLFNNSNILINSLSNKKFFDLEKTFKPDFFIASAERNFTGLPWFLDFSHLIFYFFFFSIVILVMFITYFINCLTSNKKEIRPVRETRGYSRAQIGDSMTSIIPITWSITMLMHASLNSSNFDENTSGSQFVVSVIAYQWGWNYYFPRDIINIFNKFGKVVGHGGTEYFSNADYSYSDLLEISRSDILKKQLVRGIGSSRLGKNSINLMLSLYLKPFMFHNIELPESIFSFQNKNKLLFNNLFNDNLKNSISKFISNYDDVGVDYSNNLFSLNYFDSISVKNNGLEKNALLLIKSDFLNLDNFFFNKKLNIFNFNINNFFNKNTFINIYFNEIFLINKTNNLFNKSIFFNNKLSTFDSQANKNFFFFNSKKFENVLLDNDILINDETIFNYISKLINKQYKENILQVWADSQKFLIREDSNFSYSNILINQWLTLFLKDLKKNTAYDNLYNSILFYNYNYNTDDMNFSFKNNFANAGILNSNFLTQFYCYFSSDNSLLFFFNSILHFEDYWYSTANSIKEFKHYLVSQSNFALASLINKNEWLIFSEYFKIIFKFNLTNNVVDYSFFDSSFRFLNSLNMISIYEQYNFLSNCLNYNYYNQLHLLFWPLWIEDNRVNVSFSGNSIINLFNFNNYQILSNFNLYKNFNFNHYSLLNTVEYSNINFNNYIFLNNILYKNNNFIKIQNFNSYNINFFKINYFFFKNNVISKFFEKKLTVGVDHTDSNLILKKSILLGYKSIIKNELSRNSFYSFEFNKNNNTDICITLNYDNELTYFNHHYTFFIVNYKNLFFKNILSNGDKLSLLKTAKGAGLNFVTLTLFDIKNIITNVDWLFSNTIKCFETLSDFDKPIRSSSTSKDSIFFNFKHFDYSTFFNNKYLFDWQTFWSEYTRKYSLLISKLFYNGLEKRPFSYFLSNNYFNKNSETSFKLENKLFITKQFNTVFDKIYYIEKNSNKKNSNILLDIEKFNFYKNLIFYLPNVNEEFDISYIYKTWTPDINTSRLSHSPLNFKVNWNFFFNKYYKSIVRANYFDSFYTFNISCRKNIFKNIKSNLLIKFSNNCFNKCSFDIFKNKKFLNKHRIWLISDSNISIKDLNNYFFKNKIFENNIFLLWSNFFKFNNNFLLFKNNYLTNLNLLNNFYIIQNFKEKELLNLLKIDKFKQCNLLNQYFTNYLNLMSSDVKNIIFFNLNFCNHHLYEFNNSFIDFKNIDNKLLISLNKIFKQSLLNNFNSYRDKFGFLNLSDNISNSRRLKVSKGICLPSDIYIHLILTSKDVIHSWAVPGLNIKIDCIPGFNSHRNVIFRWRGVYWGQCMEVCGRYHHWMPILIKIVHKDNFLLWCLTYLRFLNKKTIMSHKNTFNEVTLNNWISTLQNSKNLSDIVSKFDKTVINVESLVLALLSFYKKY